MIGKNSIRYSVKYSIWASLALFLTSILTIDASAITPQSEKLYDNIFEFLNNSYPKVHSQRTESIPSYTYLYVYDCLNKRDMVKREWDKPIPRYITEDTVNISYAVTAEDFNFELGVYAIYLPVDDLPVSYFLLTRNDKAFLYTTSHSQLMLINELLEINKTDPTILPDRDLHQVLSKITYGHRGFWTNAAN